MVRIDTHFEAMDDVTIAGWSENPPPNERQLKAVGDNMSNIIYNVRPISQYIVTVCIIINVLRCMALNMYRSLLQHSTLLLGAQMIGKLSSIPHPKTH